MSDWSDRAHLPWLEIELQIIREDTANRVPRKVTQSKLPGRSLAAVCIRAGLIRQTMTRTGSPVREWTPERVAHCRKLVAEKGLAQAAEEIGKKPRALEVALYRASAKSEAHS